MKNYLRDFLNTKPIESTKTKSVKLKTGLIVEHFYNYEKEITQIIVKKLHRVR